jgi:hypothetical protein
LKQGSNPRFPLIKLPLYPSQSRLLSYECVHAQTPYLLRNSCHCRCIARYMREKQVSGRDACAKEVMQLRRSHMGTDPDKCQEKHYLDNFKHYLDDKWVSGGSAAAAWSAMAAGASDASGMASGSSDGADSDPQSAAAADAGLKLSRRSRRRLRHLAKTSARASLYLVEGTVVCRQALQMLFGQAKNSVSKWHQRKVKTGSARSRRAAAEKRQPKADAICAWFERDYASVGNKQPDTGLVIVEKFLWAELVEEFKACHGADFGGDEARLSLSLQYFARVIRTCFPEVRQRKTRGISGKCLICDQLNEAYGDARKLKNTKLAHQYLRLRLLHNQYFNKVERQEYMDRRNWAAANPLIVRAIHVLKRLLLMACVCSILRSDL